MNEDFVPGVPVSFLQMKLWCLYMNREIEWNARQSTAQKKGEPSMVEALMAEVLAVKELLPVAASFGTALIIL